MNESSIIKPSLVPGAVDQKFFELLIEISSLRSEKVIAALQDYFVYGKNRARISIQRNVNQGYLSLKIRELQNLNNKLFIISNYMLACESKNKNSTTNFS
ncbi:PapB/FocB family fimbrial expression transcriptional regulator [Escherichia coli B12:H4]